MQPQIKSRAPEECTASAQMRCVAFLVLDVFRRSRMILLVRRTDGKLGLPAVALDDLRETLSLTDYFLAYARRKGMFAMPPQARLAILRDKDTGEWGDPPTTHRFMYFCLNITLEAPVPGPDVAFVAIDGEADERFDFTYPVAQEIYASLRPHDSPIAI